MDDPHLVYTDSRVVDCRDLDRFVNMHLEGFGASWAALDTGYDGYHNGSYEKVNVKFGSRVNDYEDQDFTRWLMGNGPFYLDEETEAYSQDLPGISNMLQWLCNTGKIPEGQYLITLWW